MTNTWRCRQVWHSRFCFLSLTPGSRSELLLCYYIHFFAKNMTIFFTKVHVLCKLAPINDSTSKKLKRNLIIHLGLQDLPFNFLLIYKVYRVRYVRRYYYPTFNLQDLWKRWKKRSQKFRFSSPLLARLFYNTPNRGWFSYGGKRRKRKKCAKSHVCCTHAFHSRKKCRGRRWCREKSFKTGRISYMGNGGESSSFPLSWLRPAVPSGDGDDDILRNFSARDIKNPVSRNLFFTLSGSQVKADFPSHKVSGEKSIQRFWSLEYDRCFPQTERYFCKIGRRAFQNIRR